MKRFTPYAVHAALGLAVVSAAAIAGSSIATQPGDDSAKPAHVRVMERLMPAGMTEEEMMAKWMALGTPSAGHEYLRQFVGEYTTVSTFSMPGEAPMQTEGTASFEMVLGGRFLVQHATGEMMGMPFEGLGYTGYDNARNQFTMAWMDSMGTGIYTAQGSIDPSGKVMTMFGRMDEPTTGEIDKTVKWVTRVNDDGTFQFEGWEVQYGDPMKVMEVKYTKKN